MSWVFNFHLFFILGSTGFSLPWASARLPAASRGSSSLRGPASQRWALSSRSPRSGRAGLRSCGARAQKLRPAGFVAPRQVGSSRTRGRSRVPCIGRQIPIHCATGEVLSCALIKPYWLLSSDWTAWRRQGPRPRAVAAVVNTPRRHKGSLGWDRRRRGGERWPERDTPAGRDRRIYKVPVCLSGEEF